MMIGPETTFLQLIEKGWTYGDLLHQVEHDVLKNVIEPKYDAISRQEAIELYGTQARAFDNRKFSCTGDGKKRVYSRREILEAKKQGRKKI